MTKHYAYARVRKNVQDDTFLFRRDRTLCGIRLTDANRQDLLADDLMDLDCWDCLRSDNGLMIRRQQRVAERDAQLDMVKQVADGWSWQEAHKFMEAHTLRSLED